MRKGAFARRVPGKAGERPVSEKRWVPKAATVGLQTVAVKDARFSFRTIGDIETSYRRDMGVMKRVNVSYLTSGKEVVVTVKPFGIKNKASRGVMYTSVSSWNLSRLAKRSMDAVIKSDPSEATFVEID